MKKGFTLLELLIVVVILGVLALIAAPTLLDAADQSKEGAVKANVSAAASTITSQFALETDKTPQEIIDTVAGKLNENNTNPFTGAADPFKTSDAGGKGNVCMAPGTEVDADGNTVDFITVKGYGKDGTAKITKKIAAPASGN